MMKRWRGSLRCRDLHSHVLMLRCTFDSIDVSFFAAPVA